MTGRTLRFMYLTPPHGWTTEIESTVTIPDADSTWHQAGFVYQGGDTDPTVTFCFDGELLGDPIPAPGLPEISSVDSPWTFIEDYGPYLSASGDEYYDNGFYDEAALWTRALYADEMQALCQDGITANVIPEPSTFALLSVGSLAVIAYAWRRRRR